MIKYGFGKEDITPKRGIGLCGYFEPRYNKGAHDPLTIKAALFESNGIVSGIVSYDLCLMGRAMIEKIKAAVKNGGFAFAENLLYSCTHTHTGPYTSAVFSDGADPEYLQSVIDKTVLAVKNAYESLAEAKFRKGYAENSSMAFNRRFWMKDGTVLTNPGKLNPDIVKPEGNIDPSIPFFVVEQDGLDRLIVANISNHTDTIGDDLVSADWPGRMEREIQNHYGYDISVITLIGCQGNINHFNVKNNVNQTCYAEACRIGKGYAVQMVANYAKELGYNNLVINCGGNVVSIGQRADETNWKFGIQNPDLEAENNVLKTVSISDLCLVTSGDYQRYYVVDGVEYCHIIDPDTLMPPNYFSAVSIICDNSGLADALSTALFNMTYEEGLELINSIDNAEAIWVYEDGSVKYSENFEHYVVE